MVALEVDLQVNQYRPAAAVWPIEPFGDVTIAEAVKVIDSTRLINHILVYPDGQDVEPLTWCEDMYHKWMPLFLVPGNLVGITITFQGEEITMYLYPQQAIVKALFKINVDITQTS